MIRFIKRGDEYNLFIPCNDDYMLITHRDNLDRCSIFVGYDEYYISMLLGDNGIELTEEEYRKQTNQLV